MVFGKIFLCVTLLSLAIEAIMHIFILALVVDLHTFSLLMGASVFEFLVYYCSAINVSCDIYAFD